MEKIILNVYDDNNEIIKTCEAKLVDIKFGTVRKLMDLLKVDEIDNTSELIKIVYGAWEEIIVILDQCFPEMEDDDWDSVKVNELLPIIIKIAKSAFGEMLKISSGNNSKN